MHESGRPQAKGYAPGDHVQKFFCFYLSPALHPAVLINTNGRYRYWELNSSCPKQTLNATNFAARRRTSISDHESPFTHHKPDCTPAHLQRSLGGQLDLDRSQKVDLSMCRSQGLIRSLTLEAKHLRCGKIGCELHVNYRKLFHQL